MSVGKPFLLIGVKFNWIYCKRNKYIELWMQLMNIVEVNMSTENEYQEKKEVESNQVFIINTQDCIIVWWVQYSWHTLQKSKTLGYDNKIDG